jgi:hypothetical protein
MWYLTMKLFLSWSQMQNCCTQQQQWNVSNHFFANCNFSQCLLKNYVQFWLSFAFECFFLTMTNVNLTKLKKNIFSSLRKKEWPISYLVLVRWMFILCIGCSMISFSLINTHKCFQLQNLLCECNKLYSHICTYK